METVSVSNQKNRNNFGFCFFEFLRNNLIFQFAGILKIWNSLVLRNFVTKQNRNNFCFWSEETETVSVVWKHLKLFSKIKKQKQFLLTTLFFLQQNHKFCLANLDINLNDTISYSTSTHLFPWFWRLLMPQKLERTKSHVGMPPRGINFGKWHPANTPSENGTQKIPRTQIKATARIIEKKKN